MTFTDICKLLAFVGVTTAAGALPLWLYHRFGGWAAAGYVIAIFVAVTILADIRQSRRERRSVQHRRNRTE